jgi:hypothetical protein
MKINFILYPLSSYKGTGIYTYVKEIIPLLREHGIEVKINKFNEPIVLQYIIMDMNLLI